MVRILKENLQQAQNRMKVQEDKNHSDRKFAVGDIVFLKIQSYRQVSVTVRKNLKFVAKYYGLI